MDQNNEPTISNDPTPSGTVPPPPPNFGGDSAPPPPPVYDHTPPAPAGGGSLTNPTKDERTWAMFAHLSGLLVAIVATAAGMTFLGFLGPLVIYLVKKDESPFIADQAKEALNFYITCSIAALILIVLSLTLILLILTIPGMIVLGIGALVLTVIAAIKANEGQLYRYPFTLRLIN